MKTKGEHKTFGILLRKTLLANDDGVLEFFTSDFGKISIFVKKLAHSKKKSQEIDFFRLFEIILFEGRNTKSLRYINTISILGSYAKNYTLNELGFQWLERLKNTLPEERKCSQFFTGMIKLLGTVDLKNAEYFDLFFKVKCLTFSGIFPHLNESQSTETTHSLPLKTKETLEILRVSTLENYKKKILNLPEKNIQFLKKTIETIEKQSHHH